MKLCTILKRRNINLLTQLNKLSGRKYSRILTKVDDTHSIDESTLIGRIIVFLNNDYNRNTNTLQKIMPRNDIIEVINNVKTNHINNIKSLNCIQIEDLLYTLTNDKYIDNKWDFQKIFNVIDLECCSRIEALDSTTTLRLLNAYIHVVPNRITEYKFYRAAINHLTTYVQFLTKVELLQTSFYIGLKKSTKQAQTMIRTCMKQFTSEDIRKFSVEELCILCNSTFKTSTKIRNKEFLEAVRNTLNNNLYLLNDPALFVTLIKTIRHNHYQDEDLLSTISCTILFNSTFQYYSFTALCHILALYADFAYYDEAIFKLFTEKGIAKLEVSMKQDKTIHRNDSIRFKDITRFLWALSCVGYKDVDEKILKNVIVPRILEQIENGFHKSDAEELICCILYMWMLNYQAIELLPLIVTPETVRHVQEIKTKTKERLNLLLTCIYFENRKLFKELQVKPQMVQHCDLKTQLQHRPALVRVYTTLKSVAPTLEINKFEMGYQIPHLDICGITGYKKKVQKTVYIEVLDEYVCVKNKTSPISGLMQLKLRILNNLDEAVITIYAVEVDKMTEDELKEHLEYELDFLC